jgi:hypothetical protein
MVNKSRQAGAKSMRVLGIYDIVIASCAKLRYLWYRSESYSQIRVKRVRRYPMTSSRLKAKIVRVTFEKGREGLFYAQSPDLKGLLVANADLGELKKEIPWAIEEMFDACDTPVTVTEIEDDDNSWVAVPIAGFDRHLVRAS